MSKKPTKRMNRELTATEKLLNKNFGIKDFEEVIRKMEKKPKDFYQTTFFMDKATYLENLKKLDWEIKRDADAYSQAQEAARSGSIVQNLASAGLGQIQQEYIQKRKAMVHHVEVFFKRK